MERKQWILLVLAIVVIAMTIFWLEQAKDNVPSGSGSDNIATVKDQDSNTSARLPSSETSKRILEKSKRYSKAAELAGIQGYHNTNNVTIAALQGRKVVLIDFWTYSCINCQRTIPYLNAWYEQYKDDGLEIVGVHTPEFAFEHESANVQRAIEKFSIMYPVVQDNNYATWRAYGNQYWPRKYLVDIDGFIVYDHIGEGGYEETEQEIRKLLEERKQVLGEQVTMNKSMVNVSVAVTKFRNIRTPEIYLGYGFVRAPLGNDKGLQAEEEYTYHMPDVQQLDANLAYLNGTWYSNRDSIESRGENSMLTLKYSAKQVNIVAGAPKESEITVLVDGREIDKVTVKDFQLYTVADGEEYGEHTIQLLIPKGVMVYTFTFG
ncbi:redoxin domain-containing protein [Candidatus Woesearchaeota archaeon]|nr:redoxin domain-containing protein [Candidatus Woesearchaeota archaeon]